MRLGTSNSKPSRHLNKQRQAAYLANDDPTTLLQNQIGVVDHPTTDSPNIASRSTNAYDRTFLAHSLRLT